MKKLLKISGVLALILMICCPLFLLSGCEGDPNDPTMTPTTGWTFTVGQSLREATVTGFSAKCYQSVFNKDNGKYEDVEKTFEKVADAVDAGLLSSPDLDTSKAGTDKKMIVWFAGKKFEVTYSVS